jgi:hypothetical protein
MRHCPLQEQHEASYLRRLFRDQISPGGPWLLAEAALGYEEADAASISGKSSTVMT